MKLKLLLVGATLVVMNAGRAASADSDVRLTIQEFFDAFNDGFVGPANYAAEDWNHIALTGERTQGREATLKRVREVQPF